MSFPILTTLFALSAAASWGAGDFTGGLVSRRVGSFITVLVSYIVGLVVLVILALATRDMMPTLADTLWSALAGLLGMAGLGFLLRGFATGRMGIVAPISASLAASIPVVFTAITESLPSTIQILGFGLALVGVWLLTSPEAGSGRRPLGLGMAVLAGVGFGGFFTALDQVAEGAVFWPLVAGRLAGCLVLIVFAIATRRPVRAPRSLVATMALAGILDVSGNLFFLLAIQSGRLDVSTVLGSLYPAVTTILAWLIARERVVRHQVIGVVAAVLAIVLISM